LRAGWAPVSPHHAHANGRGRPGSPSRRAQELREELAALEEEERRVEARRRALNGAGGARASPRRERERPRTAHPGGPRPNVKTGDEMQPGAHQRARPSSARPGGAGDSPYLSLDGNALPSPPPHGQRPKRPPSATAGGRRQVAPGTRRASIDAVNLTVARDVTVEKSGGGHLVTDDSGARKRANYVDPGYGRKQVAPAPAPVR